MENNMVFTALPAGSVHLKGLAGQTLERVIQNRLKAVDYAKMVEPFHKRNEEDFYDPATFYAVSHYSRENPHPAYVADDETFSPLWDLFFESLDRKTHTVVCPIEVGDYGEWSYFRFDYTGY